MELQKLYKEYKRLAKITDELDERAMAYMESDDIEVYEAEWDKAYQQEWDAYKALHAEVMKLTGADDKTARAMIASDKFEQLMNLEIKEG